MAENHTLQLTNEEKKALKRGYDTRIVQSNLKSVKEQMGGLVGGAGAVIGAAAGASAYHTLKEFPLRGQKGSLPGPKPKSIIENLANGKHKFVNPANEMRLEHFKSDFKGRVGKKGVAAGAIGLGFASSIVGGFHGMYTGYHNADKNNKILDTLAKKSPEHQKLVDEMIVKHGPKNVALRHGFEPAPITPRWKSGVYDATLYNIKHEHALQRLGMHKQANEEKEPRGWMRTLSASGTAAGFIAPAAALSSQATAHYMLNGKGSKVKDSTIHSMMKEHNLDVHFDEGGTLAHKFGKNTKNTESIKTGLSDKLRKMKFGSTKVRDMAHSFAEGVDNAFGPDLARKAGPHYVPSHGLAKGQSPKLRMGMYSHRNDILAHELGHAASNQKNKVWSAIAHSHGRAALGVGGAVGAVAALKDEDTEKYAPAIAAAGPGLILAEEANANRHAFNAIKKYQGKADAMKFFKKTAIPNQLNYGTMVAAAAGTAYAASKILHREDRELAEQRNLYKEHLYKKSEEMNQYVNYIEKQATAGGEFFKNKIANGAAWTGIIAGADLVGNLAHDKINEKRDSKNKYVESLDKAAASNDSGFMGGVAQGAGIAAGVGLAGAAAYKGMQNGGAAVASAKRGFAAASGMAAKNGAGAVGQTMSGVGRAVRNFGRVFVR